MTVRDTDNESITDRARREVDDENTAEAVKVLKTKLRERARAATVLENIDREIEDLEQRIEQGNL